MNVIQNERWNRRAWLFAALIFLAVLEGCGGGGPPPADVGFHLAAKANVFMSVAALLFAQGPAFWGQGLRSLYYAALTLARLKDVNAFLDSTERFHVKVWSLSPLSIREYFAKDMKKVRKRYDYDASAGQSDAKSDLLNFLQNGVKPFELLLIQAARNIEDDYHHCNNTPATCKYCRDVKLATCLKQAAMEELDTTRRTLKEIVARNSKFTVDAAKSEAPRETKGSGLPLT